VSWAELRIKLPELELYFPIPAHREWDGELPVGVAAWLEGTEELVIYSPDGRSRRIHASYVPSHPTLLLGRSEIDYDDLESALRGGKRTGPYILARGSVLQSHDCLSRPIDGLVLSDCDSGGTGGGGGGSGMGGDISQHTRLSYFRTTKNHDPWVWNGADEVEVFGSINGGYGGCTRYTEVSKNTDYYLDPANPVYTIATAGPLSAYTVLVDAWEDDGGECLLNGSDDEYGRTFLTWPQYGTIFGTTRVTPDPDEPGHIYVRVHGVIP
jgi:hypothetical protein